MSGTNGNSRLNDVIINIRLLTEQINNTEKTLARVESHVESELGIINKTVDNNVARLNNFEEKIFDIDKSYSNRIQTLENFKKTSERNEERLNNRIWAVGLTVLGILGKILWDYLSRG